MKRLTQTAPGNGDSPANLKQATKQGQRPTPIARRPVRSAAAKPRQREDNILIEKEKRRRRVAPYCGEPKLISAAYVLRWTPDWRHLCSKKHGMAHMKNMSSSSCQIHSFLRKEVIQPQVPLRLPCYDFTPVADPTVVACLPYGLAQRLRVKPTPMV